MKLAVLTKVVPFTRETLGTISEIDGYDHCELNATNVAGDKLIYVDVHLKDGHVERMWCSEAVSAGIRNKEITMANLLALPIGIGTRDDNSTFYQIQQVSRAQSAPIVIDNKIKPVTMVRTAPVVKLEELVAF